MITEKGKAFIARNFGVNNCYALEDVVSCTVYSKGAPSERVLDTPTIVFLLVTDIVDWVRTSTGRFTLADLVAANEGNYISMSEALDITAYCIPGAAPPTAPIVPLTTPTAKITKAGIITELTSKGAIDTAAVSTTPGDNKWFMYNSQLMYQLSNLAKAITIAHISSRNPPTQTSDIQLLENRTSVSELGSSWVLARLAELPYAVTPAAPDTMSVTADSAIPLWIWDEDGEAQIPCTRYNAMAGGTAFGITVCKGGYDKMATLIIPHTHIVPPFTMPFDITLSDSGTPAHLHGKYTGTVYIDGGKGEVHVKITSYPAAAPAVPYVPLTTPPGTSKDIEILNPSVTCDSRNCDIKFNLKNNSSSGSAYVRLEVDGVPCHKRYVYILSGATKPQVLSTSITGLSSGYHNLTIAVGTVVDTDMYTHRFHVGIGIEPPAAAAKITKAGIITELTSKGAIDTAAVSTAVSTSKWYTYYGRLSWHTANFELGIEIRNLGTRNPPTQVSDISLTKSKTSVSELDRDWVLARLAELPYAAPPVTPPVTPPITKLPAPTNIRVTYLRPDYAYVEWNGILECCSDPDEQREYCGCEFGITLNGVPTKVFSDPHPGLDCEELTPGTRYTLEIQTRSPPDIYSYREPSVKVLFTFTTPIAPLTTPAPAAKITKAGIITELTSKGAIDAAAVSTTPGDNKWFMYNSQLMYQLSNLAKAITIAHISSRNPPTQTSDIQLLENRTSVSELDRDWVLARIGALPFKAPVTPPTAASLSAPEFIAEIRKRGTLDLARISMIPGDNKWFKFAGQLVYRVAGGQSGIVITSPGESNMYAAFSKNEAMVARVETNWAMARIGELPFTAPPATIQKICGWISAIGVTNLTEDHGRYVYQLAKGRTSVSDRIYNLLSPRPSKPSGAIVTEDNGRGVFQYAKGRKTTGNKISGCVF